METEVMKVGSAALTTVDDYAPELMAKAYDLYLSSNLTTVDIAIDLGLPQKVVASWVRRGGWKEKKREATMELMLAAENKFRDFMLENKLPTMQRHLRVAGKIEEAVERFMDQELKDDQVPKSMDLKRMAETLASATTVSARAVGLSDKPQETVSEHDNKRKERRPLVVIGVNAQAPPGTRMEPVTINVSEED